MSRKNTRFLASITECMKWPLTEKDNTETEIGIGRSGRRERL